MEVWGNGGTGGVCRGIRSQVGSTGRIGEIDRTISQTPQEHGYPNPSYPDEQPSLVNQPPHPFAPRSPNFCQVLALQNAGKTGTRNGLRDRRSVNQGARVLASRWWWWGVLLGVRREAKEAKNNLVPGGWVGKM